MSKQEIVTQNFNVFSVLESAITKGIDPDSLTKLVDLQERIAKSEAEQAYNADMTEAQGDMPKIIKTKKNSQTHSMYADLGAINTQITPIYTKYGFSLSFSEGEAKREEDVRITCVCSHKKGHSREFTIDLPIDNEGAKGNVNKTRVHGIASTFSYGQRYLIKLIFNLSIDEEDDDAQVAARDEHNKILIAEGERIGINYMRHCWLHYEAIQGVKDNLADDNLLGAAEYYCSLTNKEQMDIKRAPTKGGIFTVEEMKKMSGPEWNEAIQEGIKLNPDVDRSI